MLSPPACTARWAEAPQLKVSMFSLHSGQEQPDGIQRTCFSLRAKSLNSLYQKIGILCCRVTWMSELGHFPAILGEQGPAHTLIFLLSFIHQSVTHHSLIHSFHG